MHKNILAMKTKAICSFFVLFAIAAVMVSSTPAAFADHSEVTITTGSVPLAAPGCGDTDECYTPSIATVDVGGVVTMTNSDTTGIHTFTSGTVDGYVPSPDDKFDSGLLHADGTQFLWTPDTVGDYPYYCTLHVWMQGVIKVQEAEAAEEETHDDMEDPHMDDGMKDDHMMDDNMMDEHMEDKELMVEIANLDVPGGTQIDLEFSEQHVNYEIIAMQNGEEIFKESAHAMQLNKIHMIDAVGTNENPIDVKVVSLGIGHPDANQEDWVGEKGPVAAMKVVPEFGTIAMMILAVAIISIVAVTAKSRVVPRF